MKDSHVHVKKTWKKTFCGLAVVPLSLPLAYASLQEAKDSPAACVWGWDVGGSCRMKAK